jgi:hypothetical protein
MSASGIIRSVEIWPPFDLVRGPLLPRRSRAELSTTDVLVAAYELCGGQHVREPLCLLEGQHAEGKRPHDVMPSRFARRRS